MTTTPPEAPPGDQPAGRAAADAGPRVTREEVRDLGRMRRTTGRDRKLAGVAGGLARHLDIDPIIVRVGLVVLIFFGGAGLLLYLAGWLLVPSEDREQATVPLDTRSRTIALVLVGGLATLALLGDSIGQWGFPWPLILVAAVALVVLTFVDKDRRPRPTAPPVPHSVDPHTGDVTPVSSITSPATDDTAYRPTYSYEYVSRPPRPSKRRGPILFLFTLALAVLGCGTLAIAELAGAGVLPSAYPAVVVASCGLMLVVASVYGRGGGLILIGLLGSLAMLVASLLGPWHGSGSLTPTPTSAAGVSDRYQLTAGEIVLDLTKVSDPEALAGRTVHVDVRAGHVEVIVPDDLAVQADTHVGAAGESSLFDRLGGGTGGFSLSARNGPTDTAPLTLDLDVTAGQIDVHTAGANR